MYDELPVLGNVSVTPEVYNACITECRSVSTIIQYQEIGYFLAVAAVGISAFLFVLQANMDIPKEHKDLLLKVLIYISLYSCIGGLFYIGFWLN